MLMLSKVHNAYLAHDGLAIIYGDSLFDGLVTSEYKVEPRRYRGLHSSAIGDEYTISVFFNNAGWVDIGIEFAEKILKKFNLKVELKKETNVWVKREN